MKFNDLKLSEDVNKGIKNLGFKETTKVQSMVIGDVLKYKDVVVKAKTGSGKTAAFAIPIVENLELEARNPKALVLTPTRELAVQVSEEFQDIGRYKRIRSLVVYGKQSIIAQIKQLRQRVHVVVGTPGRVNDLIRRGELKLSDIDYFVLDEADELLRRGFLQDIEETISRLPDKVTTLLFSATMPQEIQSICDKHLNEPSWVEIEETPPLIKEVNIFVQHKDRFGLLINLLKNYDPLSCLIFCNTQKQVDELYDQMKEARQRPLKLHGGMNQKDRLRAINNFKQGGEVCLIATDLAARGIHVESLDIVVNYELPEIAENFIHRIGRTGRKEEEGLAISFMSENDHKARKEIEIIREQEFMTVMPEDLANAIGAKWKKEARPQKVKINKVSKKESDLVKVRIGIGKKKKVRAFDVVGAISNIDGMNKEDIGIIEVRDSCTYVDVLNFKGNLVLEGLKTVKGKNVKVVRIRKIK